LFRSVHSRVCRVLCFCYTVAATDFLQPFRPRAVHPQATEAHLLPKLRCQFAEFLLLGSLKRLRILISRTGVGLRYGLPELKLRGFSWDHFQLLREQVRSSQPLGIRLADLPTRHLQSKNRDIQHPDNLPRSVPPSRSGTVPESCPASRPLRLSPSPSGPTHPSPIFVA